MKQIPYGRQSIDAADIRAVIKVLKSSHLTQGPNVSLFEKDLASFVGSKYAVAVSSGTAALHLACLAAGLKKGHEAITSPITFLATSNAVMYTGAKPRFCDVRQSDITLDPLQLAKSINANTKAVLPVHFSGFPADLPQIWTLAKKHNFVVIEDACHALGAEYPWKGKQIKIGSCQHSDMAVFSFHPVKHITTGEGGAITTNDKRTYERLKLLRTHGMYKDDAMTRQRPWVYEMRDLGFNYRITDIQCALGIAQLKKINRFIARRRAIKEQYDEVFGNMPFVMPLMENDRSKSAYHLYILKMDFKKLKTTRAKVMQALKAKGIQTQVHYIPVYRQPFYRQRFKYSPQDFPMAESYYEQGLSIPMYAAMKDQDVRRVVKAIKELA